MHTLKKIVVFALLMTPAYLIADEKTVSHEELKMQGEDFFHDYLNTYNKRFGFPDRREAFIDELSSLIHKPFLMSPPSVSSPFYPETREQLTRSFDGFVQQLEQQGAVKMEWQEINLEVLTPHKMLANNIGQAFNADGEVVYETISVYLIIRDQDQWKIALFSPYQMENKLDISRND